MMKFYCIIFLLLYVVKATTCQSLHIASCLPSSISDAWSKPFGCSGSGTLAIIQASLGAGDPDSRTFCDDPMDRNPGYDSQSVTDLYRSGCNSLPSCDVNLVRQLPSFSDYMGQNRHVHVNYECLNNTENGKLVLSDGATASGWVIIIQTPGYPDYCKAEDYDCVLGDTGGKYYNLRRYDFADKESNSYCFTWGPLDGCGKRDDFITTYGTATRIIRFRKNTSDYVKMYMMLYVVTRDMEISITCQRFDNSSLPSETSHNDHSFPTDPSMIATWIGSNSPDSDANSPDSDANNPDPDANSPDSDANSPDSDANKPDSDSPSAGANSPSVNNNDERAASPLPAGDLSTPTRSEITTPTTVPLQNETRAGPTREPYSTQSTSRETTPTIPTAPALGDASSSRSTVNLFTPSITMPKVYTTSTSNPTTEVLTTTQSTKLATPSVATVSEQYTTLSTTEKPTTPTSMLTPSSIGGRGPTPTTVSSVKDTSTQSAMTTVTDIERTTLSGLSTPSVKDTDIPITHKGNSVLGDKELGVLIGCAVGGALLAAIIVIVAAIVHRRMKRSKNKWIKEEPEKPTAEKCGIN